MAGFFMSLVYLRNAFKLYQHGHHLAPLIAFVLMREAKSS